MQTCWLKKLTFNHRHNAFTDLCYYQDTFYCCFRQASTHVSQDGVVAVLTLTAQGKITGKQTLRITGADLRDPKLSVTPNNQLMLHAQARFTGENNQTRYSQGVCWQSQDGLSWSQETFFGDKNWWVWRLCWQGHYAMGFGYNRSQNAINLYQGAPRRTFELIQPEVLSLAKHGKGYPNESDIIFLEDQTAIAIVRRDADTCTAQLGRAVPPYKKWHWTSLPAYIGGPAMIRINNAQVLVAGRSFNAKGPVTVLYRLDLTTSKIEHALTLKSGGDCSYPGLIILNNDLFISYYSSHEGSCDIYLSKIQLA